ncbi:MAG: DUF3971 domain-containing protein, partial [Rhodospirillales bacterium]|nr:DUF3971 domain-containing protein [Rhodospirillales bacterium]
TGIGADDQEPGDSGIVLDKVWAALTGRGAPDDPVSHLRAIEVSGGEVTVIDQALNLTWRAPRADIRLGRLEDGNLSAEFRAKLDLAGEVSNLKGEARWETARAAGQASLAFSDIRPATFSRLTPEAAPLAALDLPLGGTITAAYAEGGVQWVEAQVSAEQGVVRAPAPVSAEIGIVGLSLRGALRDRLSKGEISELTIDLGGPKVSATAQVEGLHGAPVAVVAQAAVRDLPVNDLERFWPAVAVPGARDWVLNNLRNGMMREARVEFAGRVPEAGADLVLDRLDGTIRPEGVTVRYLHPMPPMVGVNADIRFDRNLFTIAIKSGEVAGLGLKLRESTVVIHDLTAKDQYMTVELLVAGPVPEVLKLIDSKPLGFASTMGIQPGRTKGSSVTRARLRFPLLRHVSLNDVAVTVHADAKDLFLPDVVLGQDLSGGALSLDVDTKGLDARGNIVLGGVPAELQWRENFVRGQAPFRSRYHLKAVLDDHQRALFRLDGPPFQAPFMTGPVPAEVVALLTEGGNGDIEARANLGSAAMVVPGLGWRKAAGVAGTATVAVKLAKGKLADIPRFTVAAGEGGDALSLSGRVDFVDGAARRVEFQRIAKHRTSASGTLTIRPGGAGLDIDVRGPSFDAAPLLARGEPKHRGGAAADDKDKPPPMSVKAEFSRVWLGQNNFLKRVSARASRNARDWRDVRLEATVGEGKSLTAEIRPVGRQRSVIVTGEDAGATLRAFDLFDNVVGGAMRLEGMIDDSKPGQPMEGHATVTDYQLVKAPVLARILTVAALTGIVDLLRGDGITFSNLDAPFALTEGLLELKGARAYGPALGVTAKGEIDLDTGIVAIEGTVVPAYAVNSILGHIPLIGGLLTGEKGSGVFSATYYVKGPKEDPQITVNPLSALTPGFLRNLFSIFESGKETEARPR